MCFLLFLFLFGAILGAVTNAFVDRFSWIPRFRSPWRQRPVEMAAVSRVLERQWPDFLPLIGWIRMARWGDAIERLPEKDRLPGLESRRFWIRPFCVELCCAFGFVALYFGEMGGILQPSGVEPESATTILQRYWVHLTLFVLLLMATLIDFDDMIIPDILTVPGTLLALVLATFCPHYQLPATQLRMNVIYQANPQAVQAEDNFVLVYSKEPKTVPLSVTSPNPPLKLPLSQRNLLKMQLAMLGLWAFWCFAMLDRVWYGRRLGLRRSLLLFFRYLYRSPRTKYWLGALFFGPVATFILLSKQCTPLDVQGYWASAHAVGLFSALVGMATGMLLVWSVRLVASGALGREAMGFGDVTLMGMIGAFLGWQAVIPIFFLAPILGLVHGLFNLFLGRELRIPFGPWLCLATFFVVLGWPHVWEQMAPVYELGWILAAIMFICLILMGLMLFVWAQIRERLFAPLS